MANIEPGATVWVSGSPSGFAIVVGEKGNYYIVVSVSSDMHQPLKTPAHRRKPRQVWKGNTQTAEDWFQQRAQDTQLAMNMAREEADKVRNAIRS